MLLLLSTSGAAQVCPPDSEPPISFLIPKQMPESTFAAAMGEEFPSSCCLPIKHSTSYKLLQVHSACNNVLPVLHCKMSLSRRAVAHMERFTCWARKLFANQLLVEDWFF